MITYCVVCGGYLTGGYMSMPMVAHKNGYAHIICQEHMTSKRGKHDNGIADGCPRCHQNARRRELRHLYSDYPSIDYPTWVALGKPKDLNYGKWV